MLSVVMGLTSRGDFSVAKHTTVLKRQTNLTETSVEVDETEE